MSLSTTCESNLLSCDLNSLLFNKFDIIKEINDKDDIFYYHIIGTLHKLAKLRNIKSGDMTSLGGGECAYNYDENDNDAYIIYTLIDLNKLKNNNTEYDFKKISKKISTIGLDGSILINDKNNYKFIKNINHCELIYITREECNQYCPGYIDY